MSETATANPVHAWIAKSVAENPVILFMKGEPEQPRCGFSATCVQILDHLEVEFVGVDRRAATVCGGGRAWLHGPGAHVVCVEPAYACEGKVGQGAEKNTTAR